MDINIANHFINSTNVPNVIIYTFIVAIIALLFALVITSDSIDEKEDCFSEEVQAKIATFNQGEEEPSKEQIAEIYKAIEAKEAKEVDSDDTSEDEDLPDILLIVRAKYRDAEDLLANKVNQQIKVQDVKFLDFYPSLYTNIPQNLKKIRRNSL